MTDFLLVAWLSALVELRRFGWMLGLGKPWSAGEKLKLLFAGYNGTRNTGSDVRVQEMLRQLRHVLGADNVDFRILGEPKATLKARGRSICPTFFRRSCFTRCGRTTASSRAKARCSKASSPTR